VLIQALRLAIDWQIESSAVQKPVPTLKRPEEVAVRMSLPILRTFIRGKQRLDPSTRCEIRKNFS
jgi:hypothetical protein